VASFCLWLALVQTMPIPSTAYIAGACRLNATLSNPSYLAAILVVTIIIATGFLVRSLLPVQDQDSDPDSLANSPGEYSAGARRIWQVFWLAAAVLGIWVLLHTGTRGAFVGLVAGALAMPLALAIWGNRKALRPVALGAGGILGLVFLLFVLGETAGFPTRAGCREDVVSSRVSGLVSEAAREGSIKVENSVGHRLAYLDIGVQTFLDRPILGWGHGNFGAAFDRFSDASIYRYGTTRTDSFQSQPVEELATHGLLGTLAFVALWLTLLWAVVRRRRHPREEVVAYAVLGALGAYFVQNLFLFHTPATMLYWVILVGWVAGQHPAPEPAAEPVSEQTANAAPSVKQLLAAKLGPAVLGMAILVVIGAAGYYMVFVPYSSSRTFIQAYDGSASWHDRFILLASESFDRLPGMSSFPKELMFERVKGNLKEFNLTDRWLAAEFVEYEIQRTLDKYPRNVRVVSSGLPFLQETIPREGVERLDPLLGHLRLHAPEQDFTFLLGARQEMLKGNYEGAIRVIEEFEALTPWVPDSLREIKKSAADAMAD